jgi:hypothetical protein
VRVTKLQGAAEHMRRLGFTYLVCTDGENVRFTFDLAEVRSQLQTKPVSNDDVIQMVSLGIGDDVIIEKIRSATTTNFDTSIDGLKVLKAAKVSDAVPKAMISPHGELQRSGVVDQPVVKENTKASDQVHSSTTASCPEGTTRVIKAFGSSCEPTVTTPETHESKNESSQAVSGPSAAYRVGKLVLITGRHVYDWKGHYTFANGSVDVLVRTTPRGAVQPERQLAYSGFMDGIDLVTFASPDDIKPALGESVSIAESNSFLVADVLNGKTPFDVRKGRYFLSRLMRECWERWIGGSTLGEYALSNRANCYFFKKGDLPNVDVSFTNLEGKKTYRSVVGSRVVVLMSYCFDRPRLAVCAPASPLRPSPPTAMRSCGDRP